MEQAMNIDGILSFVRHILTFGGGFLVTNGTLSASDMETAVGAIITLGGIVWGIFDKRQRA